MLQSNLFLWGFHSKTFRFWNETTGELIFEHNCGGANRIWDFYLPPGTESSLPLDTTSSNGETRLIPKSLSGTEESTPIRDVTQGAWLMYTSKSEVHLSIFYSLTKVAFSQTRNQTSPEIHQKRQSRPWNPMSFTYPITFIYNWPPRLRQRRHIHQLHQRFHLPHTF